MNKNWRHQSRARAALLFTSVLVSGCMTAQTLAAPSGETGSARDVQRIVAVGDIHGAHNAFVGLLRASNLIDATENWSGGDTHLVSLGDILDRGADSRKSMDLFMKLQVQSQQTGGQVHVVAGNHELMNVIGDLRYVAKGEYAAFAEDETDAMRSAAFTELNGATSISQIEFDQRFPKGYFAHRAAFAPNGKYGKWLLSLPAVVVVNDTAFVHGGLPELVANSGLSKTNKTYMSALTEFMDVRQQLFDDGLLPNDETKDLVKLARQQLENNSLKSKQKRVFEKFIELDDRDILNRDGPIWYRGAMLCRPVFEKPILEASLAKLGAKRVVVGHTPSRDGQVHTRYQGKLIQLDTGMLVSHYKGRPSALVIQGSEIKVQYLSPTQMGALSAEKKSPAIQAQPEIETALQQGTVQVIVVGVGNEPTRVKISHLGKTYDGVFTNGEGDVAAYRLDQVLGFDIVPPTVTRTVGGQPGSLQISYAEAVSDTDRRANNVSIGGWCPVPRQYQLMLAFDILTANTARTGDNLFYRPDQGLIHLTQFNSAFSTSKRLPSGIKRDAVKLSPGIKQALKELDGTRLKSSMQGLISDAQIDALLARRDAMLKKFK